MRKGRCVLRVFVQLDGAEPRCAHSDMEVSVLEGLESLPHLPCVAVLTASRSWLRGAVV